MKQSMTITGNLRRRVRLESVACFTLGCLTIVGCSAVSAPHPVALQPASDTTHPAPAAPERPEDATSWRYALVIDASSSASALQIYQWRPKPGHLPRIEPAPYPRAANAETWEIKVEPGLSAYAARPDEAARSLQPLIEFALEKIGSDPQTLSRSALLLRATAGVRLLPDDQRTEVLSAIREMFEALPFGQSSARVISGSEEGVYGWIAVNYILGHLEHGGPFPTVGALDLGGASTQITFVPLDYPRSHGQAVTIGANTYHLYTYSYLGLGQDEARSTVGSTACFIRDFPMPGGRTGTGDFEACRREIRKAFSSPCREDSPCSLFGVYQPPLYGEFLAFSVYAYATDFFDLGQQLVPERISEEGAAFCTQDWNDLVAADPEIAGNPYLPNYCYAAAHIATLLTEGFGFTDTTERITAPIRVQGSSVGWALGALVYELAGSGD
jgi:apyrase